MDDKIDYYYPMVKKPLTIGSGGKPPLNFHWAVSHHRFMGDHSTR